MHVSSALIATCMCARALIVTWNTVISATGKNIGNSVDLEFLGAADEILGKRPNNLVKSPLFAAQRLLNNTRFSSYLFMTL